MAFSNAGHVFTHMLTILYATAVLYLPSKFDLSYGEMLGLSSVGLILFGVGSLPAGWFGDRWSQVGMLVIFFIGIGVSTAFTGLATNTTSLFIGLSLIGLFASIYHPVGIAWLVACARRQGLTLGVNGAFGHLGSAVAPVFVGLMIDYVSWRAAFVLPGAAAILTGALLWVAWAQGWVSDRNADRVPVPAPAPGDYRRVFLVLLVTMACNGFVYAGMMNTAPKVFEVGLTVTFTDSYTGIGILTGTVIGLSSVCSFIGGWLADRYSPRRILPCVLDVAGTGIDTGCDRFGVPSHIGDVFSDVVSGDFCSGREYVGGSVHAIQMALAGIRCPICSGTGHRWFDGLCGRRSV